MRIASPWPARCDQAGLGAPHLDQRIGPDRGAVQQQVGLPEEVLQGEVELLRRFPEGVQEALGEVRGGRGGLGVQDVACLVQHDTVGERASDVDAAVVAHCPLLLPLPR